MAQKCQFYGAEGVQDPFGENRVIRNTFVNEQLFSLVYFCATAATFMEQPDPCQMFRSRLFVLIIMLLTAINWS